MPEPILTRLLEHHNWANLRLLEACEALSDAQLDAAPPSATHGTIRATLRHLVTSEEDYVSMLTTGDHPPEREAPTLAELRQSLNETGGALIACARGATDRALEPVDLSDGYRVAPWVIVTQAVNHATEHREQIKSLLSALGIEPPRIDGWRYGREQDALVPPRL